MDSQKKKENQKIYRNITAEKTPTIVKLLGSIMNEIKNQGKSTSKDKPFGDYEYNKNKLTNKEIQKMTTKPNRIRYTR